MTNSTAWFQDALEHFLINYVTKRVEARGDFPRDGYAYANVTSIKDGFITIGWYHQRHVTDWTGSSRVSGETTFSIPRALRMFMVSNDEEMQVCEQLTTH